MNITRRDAIRHCLIITIGAAIIPSCQEAKRKPPIILNNLRIDSDEEKLLTEICETIIPATQTPGAKETLAHLFVLKMVDDIYSEEEQQQFVKGIKEFDKFAQNKLNKSYVDATGPQKEELLVAIINNNGKDVSQDVATFIKTMKKLTVQGFISSKHYLTKVRVYELVPGRFHGCFPVTSLNQKKLQLNKKETPV